MSGWRIGSDSLSSVQAEYRNVILVVKHYELLSTKLDLLNRSSSLKVERHANTSLAKNVDLTRTELRVVGAYGEEGLYRLVGKSRNLRVDPIPSELNS